MARSSRWKSVQERIERRRKPTAVKAQEDVHQAAEYDNKPSIVVVSLFRPS